jgi:DNA-binding IclR family transcriptional regulator
LTQGIGSGVQSVERAIAILRSFSTERPERGVGELAQELGLHKSTVSRLMRTLERGGLLARNPETRRYSLGLYLIGLASQVVSHLDVREVARPHLRQLADDCRETVDLVVLQGGQVVNLEQYVSPSRQIKHIGRVGRRMSAHCTAAGKVMLAHLAASRLDEVLDVNLPRFTSNTVTDRDKLRQQLVEVREQGFAVAQEELEEGLNAVAAPIYSHTGFVVAAISVAGPAYRVPQEVFPRLAGRVVDVADQISQQLGYVSGQVTD